MRAGRNSQKQSKAGSARRAWRAAGAGPGRGARFHRQQALALQALARELACPANRLGLFTRLFFGRFLVVPAQLHLAENALALHLLLQRLEGLIDVVVANLNQQAVFPWVVPVACTKAGLGS